MLARGFDSEITMSKFVSTLLFLVLVGIARSSDPLASIRSKVVPQFQRRGMIEAKQAENCTLPSTYPPECDTASNDFEALIAGASSFQNINLDRLMDALDVICSSMIPKDSRNNFVLLV